GWVSGTADHAGEFVFVRYRNYGEAVRIEPGNTFAWEYRAKPTPTRPGPNGELPSLRPPKAEFEFRGKKQTVLLQASPPPNQPDVFFLTDRTAYRPGQTLHFVAFVRRLDARGDWLPVANKAVVVTLQSRTRQTTVANLKLRTDAAGRVAGEYAFHEAD